MRPRCFHAGCAKPARKGKRFCTARCASSWAESVTESKLTWEASGARVVPVYEQGTPGGQWVETGTEPSQARWVTQDEQSGDVVEAHAWPTLRWS